MHKPNIKENTPKKTIILFVFCLLTLSLCLSGCLNPQSRWRSGGLGIQLAEVEDGVVIKDIAPTFNNPEASLLTGDYVVAVDGRDVSNLPKEAILDIISGPVGSVVVVTVLRDGHPVTLEIERILLINAQKRTLYSVSRAQSAPAQPEKTAETPSSASVEKAATTAQDPEAATAASKDSADAQDTEDTTDQTSDANMDTGADTDSDGQTGPVSSDDAASATPDADDNTVEN